MTAAERLAREIYRVAMLRGHHSGTQTTNGLRTGVDTLLDEACKAIGTGDEGRIEAAGLQLKTVENA